MEKISTQDKITQLLMLETNLLNYRMKEFACLVQTQDESAVYYALAMALQRSMLSRSDDIYDYLERHHKDLTDKKIREQAAMTLNLMSRSSENVYHTVSLYKYNEEIKQAGDLTNQEEKRKELEAKYEKNKAYYHHIAKKADRIQEILAHPSMASEDEKLLLAVMDERIQKIIEDVYLKMEGKKGNGAPFVSLDEVLNEMKN